MTEGLIETKWISSIYLTSPLRCVAVSVVVAHVDVAGLHVAAHGQQGVQRVRLLVKLRPARPLLAAQPEVAVHGRVVAAVTRVLAGCNIT